MICLLLLGCDAHYDILMTNSSEDTVKIYTKSFYHQESIQLYPKQTVLIGGAINGLENDVPFDELIIYKGRDSSVVKNNEEILTLFRRNMFGQYKTPYELVIK